MLKKHHRLEIKRNLTLNNTVVSPLFTIKYNENNLTNSRFGFIISKRIDKRATARNRIRRVISSCVEELIKGIRPNTDFLFIVKSGIRDKERDVVMEEIKKKLHEQKLYETTSHSTN